MNLSELKIGFVPHGHLEHPWNLRNFVYYARKRKLQFEIEQADKDDNPHKRKFVENNEKYLGLSGGRNNETKYGREWNEKYQLDLIGRDYCRDRSIACEKSEFDFLITWKKQKANFVMAHENDYTFSYYSKYQAILHLFLVAVKKTL